MLTVTAVIAGTQASQPPSTQAPLRVFALNAEALSQTRERLRKGDGVLQLAYVQLISDAQRALRAPLVSVTHKKTMLPPTNDKHDYFSLSPYWWPDPSKPDGLPYIRRDGETNPESKRDLDQPRVAALGYNTHTLALAYYFSGEEIYAERAATQVRAWFLDPATRMNPHLRFSQLVRGNPNERGSGIIDTRWLIEVVDAVGLIAGSKHWSAADQHALQAWFKQYLNWLLTSPNGKHEFAARNNHGSWFAAQTGAYATFVGDTTTARQIVETAKFRIGSQITTEGKMPEELARTRSMHYHSFNIEALSRIAEMGRLLRINLWTYEAPSGGSLRKAIDHLAPYVANPKQWPGQQIDDVEVPLMLIHLRRANWAYGDTRYAADIERLPKDLTRADRSALLYPDK